MKYPASPGAGCSTGWKSREALEAFGGALGKESEALGRSAEREKKSRGLLLDDCSAIIDGMASMTIRNLDPETKARLRLRAAQHQRSMEEEARRILKAALDGKTPTPTNLADAVRARFRRVGGVELELPSREPMREPPRPRR